MEVGGTRPLDFMIPKFLAHIDSPYPKIRAHAFSCTIQFISPDNNALTLHLEPFMVALFKHASDDSSDVRKIVCQALVQLLATRPDVLIPHLPSVVDFMLFSTQASEDDEEVALEACEFWLTFAEDPELVDQLRPFLPKVIPVLLQSMIYSEDDIIILDTDVDDAAVPDRAEDIKPHLLSSKTHTNERVEDPNAPPGSQPGAAGGKSRADGEDGDESDEEDYDEDEDDEAYTEWNLRKCSAAALDVMAVAFETEMMEVLLPYLKEKLFSADWLDRESGILALGAIAEGEFVVLSRFEKGADDSESHRLHHRYRASPSRPHGLPHQLAQRPQGEILPLSSRAGALADLAPDTSSLSFAPSPAGQ